MKFTINKETILSPFAYAGRISERSNINSYYSFLIFRVAKNTLVVQSADKQSTFEETITTSEIKDFVVEQEGAALLPVIKTGNIIQNMPDGLIHFELKKDEIVIKPKENPSEISFSIRTRPVEDFPVEIHREMPKEIYNLPAQGLYNMIHRTEFAATPSGEGKDTSLFLTGLFFETRDGFLVVVATDRSRISIAKTPVNFEFKKTEGQGDIIVPSKIMGFVKKIAAETDGTVQIAVDNDRIYFKSSHVFISSNLITGKYYDYTKIVPQKTRNTAVVNKNMLKTALTRVSLIGDDRKHTPVRFTLENDMLFISSEEKDSGSSSEKIPVQLKGEKGLFAAKAQFVSDPLQVIDTPEVIIDYGTEKRDLIKITSTDDTDDAIHITVPFNI